MDWKPIKHLGEGEGPLFGTLVWWGCLGIFLIERYGANKLQHFE